MEKYSTSMVLGTEKIIGIIFNLNNDFNKKDFNVKKSYLETQELDFSKEPVIIKFDFILEHNDKKIPIIFSKKENGLIVSVDYDITDPDKNYKLKNRWRKF